MQEEMHEQMTGYKRMRREHQAALIKVGGSSKLFLIKLSNLFFKLPYILSLYCLAGGTLQDGNGRPQRSLGQRV